MYNKINVQKMDFSISNCNHIDSNPFVLFSTTIVTYSKTNTSSFTNRIYINNIKLSHLYSRYFMYIYEFFKKREEKHTVLDINNMLYRITHPTS